MSKARTKLFKKFGITDKKEIRKWREYIRSFPSCNRGYAYRNLSAHLGRKFELPTLSINPNKNL